MRRSRALVDLEWVLVFAAGVVVEETSRIGGESTRRLVLLIAAAMTLVACSSVSPSASIATVKLGVSNGTTLTVSLFVNGRHIADVRAGGPVPTIDPASLPPLPWNVEARSASGRVLTSMTVEPGQVSATTGPGGEIFSGRSGRVDLSCGRLTIWAGDAEPTGPGPLPSAGSPGDCVP